MEPGESHIFDLVVVGASAPGVIAAVRAAREGLQVALVSANGRLGSFLPSLGAVETHYRGNRAPLLHEFGERVRAHYRETYGADSEQFRACDGPRMLSFEPRVAEAVLERMVAAEANLRVFRGFAPAGVTSEGRRVAAVVLRDAAGGIPLRLRAATFIEAGDEGDFMALAGVRWRLGREGRDEYGEPRAGRVFTRWLSGTFPRAAVEGRLNLVTAGATTSEPLPGSTGEGDGNVQSFSHRLCLTDDPANRRPIDVPPEDYDRARFLPILLPPAEKAKLPLPFHHRFLISTLREMVERDHVFHGHALPNRKRSWNATNLTGAGREWASADAAGRRAIVRRHLDHALGLLWFLQNDPAMPDDLRARAREWGLARDEFTDSGNLPPELYVREARRLVGRSVFTEHDALLAPGAARAPLHVDSVGITEFSLDSLACTTERLGDSLCDGQLFQMEVSVPGQVPFGALLPVERDNLLVVTTVSATHVGWGTVRQTPTQMHLAESAAWAAVLAARHGTAPADLAVSDLQRTLVERGVMLTFFNDCDMARREPWVPAIQYLGTRGYFASYDARPAELLGEDEAVRWAQLARATPEHLRGRTRAAAAQILFAAIGRP